MHDLEYSLLILFHNTISYSIYVDNRLCIIGMNKKSNAK